MIISLITSALNEDNAANDVTAALIPVKNCQGVAEVSTRQNGVFSGSAILYGFQEIFAKDLVIEPLVAEGAVLEAGQKIARMTGPAKTLLSVERTLLNFLGHLCGVATLTRAYVKEVGSSRTRILATRKTLPGLRELQLAAVVAGGGLIHRRSLSDGILIKDNHQFLGTAEELVMRAHEIRSPLHGIEVEVQDITTLEKIIALRPDVIMLDNMELPKLIKAVTQIRTLAPHIRIEVSGGIQVSQIKDIAALNVDYISIGKITHSVANLDLTLDTEWKLK